ncbi:MAG: 50S ribosomal protein L6 [Oligoflexia bacterium]|nr:50S ribosomal protein L6 [Oligoflexia bacterium]
MSRVGKKPIEIPKEVGVNVSGSIIEAKGSKGTLKYELSECLKAVRAGTTIQIEPVDSNNITDKKVKSLWGLSRTLVSNIIRGVSVGFTKSLDYTGVGYKAHVADRKLILSLGYSHPVEYDIPAGIDVTVKAGKIEVSGCNKELVGFVSAKIRSYRPPEPYKGKGIRYSDEKIIRKAGKTGGKQQS